MESRNFLPNMSFLWTSGTNCFMIYTQFPPKTLQAIAQRKISYKYAPIHLGPIYFETLVFPSEKQFNLSQIKEILKAVLLSFLAFSCSDKHVPTWLVHKLFRRNSEALKLHETTHSTYLYSLNQCTSSLYYYNGSESTF